MEYSHVECGGWTELKGCIGAIRTIERRVWWEKVVESDAVGYVCVGVPCTNVGTVVKETVTKEVGV